MDGNRGGPARDCRDADGSAKDFIIKSLVLPCASLDSPCHILPTPPALHHILACSTTYSQLTACYPILHLPPTTLDRDSPSSGLSSSSGSPYHSPSPSPLVTRFAHPFTGQHILPWCALILLLVLAHNVSSRRDIRRPIDTQKESKAFLTRSFTSRHQTSNIKHHPKISATEAYATLDTPLSSTHATSGVPARQQQALPIWNTHWSALGHLDTLK